jgi:hypothetical protein
MEKRIKPQSIGSVHRVKYNGMKFTVTVTQDPTQYKFYSDLGLDVFEYVQTANVETKKVDDSTGKSNSKPKRNDSTNG